MPHFASHMCRSTVAVHPPFGGSPERFTPRFAHFLCVFGVPAPGDVREVGYPSSMFAAAPLVDRARVAGGVAAVAAVSVLMTSTVGASAADAPCVGAGVLAVLAPTATVPVAVGPELSAVDRQSVTTDAYADTAGGSGLKVTHVVIGVGGCIDATGTPGGTSTRATTWSALGGAVGGTSLQVDLVPVAAPGAGWHLRPKLDGLLVSGAPITLDEGATIGLGNWGVLDRPETIDAGPAAAPLRFWKAAFEVRLTRAHAGFVAGTRLLFGWVSADRAPAVPPPRVAPPPTTTTTTTPVTTTTVATTTNATPPKKPIAAKPVTHKKKHKRVAKHPKRKPHRHVSRKGLPLLLTPPVGPGSYDFPVLGTASWGDTYGAGRSDVPGGWHHGDDLFVALGTPVVAVADGTVFAVGWNSVGGWRLWLQDDQGNDFYYAHLSGYTKLARNNAQVRRGQVLGFVGNTGDAFTTIPHLHFEVHPFGLLSLGYDGAVDPTRYLAGWRRPGSRTDILPPVPLPSPNFRGSGSLTDYRRLLALRPLAKPPATVPDAVSRPKTPRVQALASGSAASSASAGWVPAASGALLLALAAIAVWLTARAGRSPTVGEPPSLGRE